MLVYSGLLSIICLSTGIFWLSKVKYRFWETPAAGFEIERVISSGLFKILLDSFLIFGAMVALNKRVWCFLGRCDMIFSRSSWNPISSILSASSKTKCLTLEKFTYPIDKWEINFPGVATIISLPLWSAFFCLSQSFPSPPP